MKQKSCTGLRVESCEKFEQIIMNVFNLKSNKPKQSNSALFYFAAKIIFESNTFLRYKFMLILISIVMAKKFKFTVVIASPPSPSSPKPHQFVCFVDRDDFALICVPSPTWIVVVVVFVVLDRCRPNVCTEPSKPWGHEGGQKQLATARPSRHHSFRRHRLGRRSSHAL